MTIAADPPRPRPVVEKQIQLPMRKALEIALRSLRVRFTRSVLTLVTIIMAIAFLTYVWSNNAWDEPIRTAVNAAKGFAAPAKHDASKTAWLISLSLLVCLVGISNAMLMSVMERFREIGTMKCLGALDSFILKLFLLESVLLGAAGTFLGILLGFAVSLLMALANFGWNNTARYLPWHTLPIIGIVSLVIGVLITAAAAMYPAWKAAHMDPINAMRVDV